jgi:FMN phosphatase YigB (HAD superfamily)
VTVPAVDRSVRALVFDLDDTLTDWWSAIRQAALAVGGEVLAEELARVVQERAWVRRSDGAVHREHWRLRTEPLTFFAESVPESETGASRSLCSEFENVLRPELYADVISFLDACAGIELGVLSNSSRAHRDLQALGVAERFRCIVELDDAVRKPRPEGFSIICDRLGLEPEQVTYIGDSPTHDVEPALAAGLRAIWLNRFNDDWTAPPEARAVASLTEISGLPGNG